MLYPRDSIDFNLISPPFSALSLNNLRLQVKLGYGEEERKNLQFVRFDIRIRFETLPPGCFSDQLQQTVCYAELSEHLTRICLKEYHLIEHLGWTAFSHLKSHLPKTLKLWIKVTKENPPISNLQEGASFALGDWNEF